MQGTARAVFVAGALGALMLALCVGSGAPLVMSFDLPDAASFDGMREERERGGRWMRSKATIEPGVVAAREAEIRLVADRPWRPAAATLLVSQGGAQRTLIVSGEPSVVRMSAEGPISVRLETEARREFGVRVQSLSVVPRGRGALLPSLGRALRMAIGAMLLVLALTVAGLTPFLAAAASVALWSLPVALFGWANPYVSLRLVDTLWFVAPLFAFVIAAFKRSLGGSGVLLGLSAALLRLMLLFHPGWYFSDVEIHLNVTRALRDEGRVRGWINMDDLQQRFDLGRASVSGAMRPLPYPPLFHTLSSLGPVEEDVSVMKSIAVGASTATILLAFLLGRCFFGSESAGVMAGLALSVLPFETLELLRVSFPAILGRTLDLAAILWLASRRAGDLASARGRLTLGVWFAACCFAYNASPVHLGLFIPIALLALVLPPARMSDAWGLLVAAVIGGLLSLVFYGRYLLDIALTVLPETRQAAPPILWWGLATNLAQFHGPTFIAALLAVPLCVGEAWRRRESRVLLAWILWVPLLIQIARSFPEPFGYFRKQFFAYPLFAVLAARWAKSPSAFSRALAVIVLAWGIIETAPYVPGVYLTHTGGLED